MIKSLVLAAVASVGALGVTSANAGVSWSVNVNTPVVGTVASGGSAHYGHAYYQPAYYEPAYYEPAYYEPGYARVYAPAPVYRVAPPVAYFPAPVYYQLVPVVYPRYYPGWRHGHWDGYGRR